MSENFVAWLIKELQTRGWSNSELSRRSGLATSTISMVMGGRNPGFEFCVGVGRALRLPPEDVLRKAGLLPSIPEMTERDKQAQHLFKQLSEEKQRFALQALRAWVERE